MGERQSSLQWQQDQVLIYRYSLFCNNVKQWDLFLATTRDQKQIVPWNKAAASTLQTNGQLDVDGL
jgi:hypothetical protein